MIPCVRDMRFMSRQRVFLDGVLSPIRIPCDTLITHKHIEV